MSQVNANLELNTISKSETTNKINAEHSNSINQKHKLKKILEAIRNVFYKIQAVLLLIISNETINKICLFLITFFSSWFLAFILFGYNALPGSIIFSLFVLISTSHAIGYLFELIKMPALFGKFKLD